MVGNSDNVRGFVLAISSSVFIGSIFIIKKKGLQKAGANGSRASAGGHAYLLEPCWWAGMVTMIAGEGANFVAYAYAPAVLVTPLGALSIIFSAVLAHFFLDERLHIFGVVGCILCLVGSTTIVLHAPVEEEIESVKENSLNGSLTRHGLLARDQLMSGHYRYQMLQFFIPHGSWLGLTGFVVYTCAILILVLLLIFRFVPCYGQTHMVVYIGICSLMGSLTVMFVKAVGIAMKLSLSGSNQFKYFETCFFTFFVILCCLVQLNYLYKALDTFNTAVVSPVYYVMFTTLTIVASVIMFKDWSHQASSTIFSELCGFVTILCGTFLLHKTKDMGGTPSPTSPVFLSNGASPREGEC